MPRRILALISSRLSKSQRSCSSCVSRRRGSTSSTLLEPVAWSCFWSLASKDASRISMVMVGSRGMGPWNPTLHKVREASDKRAFGWRSASSAAIQAVKLDGFSRRGTPSIANSGRAEL
jgi:hypothetical protein